MCCCPLPNSSASCPPSGSATRLRPQDARANGPAAPCRSAMTPKTRDSLSTRPKPRQSATSSRGIWSCRVSGNWWRTSTPRASSPNAGIPFTYGPLAHFLKNRLYIGETGHKDKWFPGEHAAIVDRKTFEQVQQLLGSKSAGRKAHRTASEALLMGQL